MKSILRVLLLLTYPTASFGQNDSLTPGDNLVVEGVPKIPAALVASVKRYTGGRSAELWDWHPSRREMLISTRFGDTRQVHLVKFPGGARSQLTFFDDNVLGGVSYRPRRGAYFVFNKDEGGNEQYQNYRYDFDTGAITPLTASRSRNSLVQHHDECDG